MTVDKLPAPLMPREVDLRDFPFMPLDVRRLRDSRLVATRSPEEVVAAVLLWAASWHQQPASSLPDDDAELSQLAGYGRAVKEFRRIRAGALHGLILCSDGRYYHPVVAEKASEAWNGRLEAEWRRASDRVRKENKDRKERGEPELPIPPKPPMLSMQHVDGIPVWEYRVSAGIPAEGLRKACLKGEGKGKGEGQGRGIGGTSGAGAPGGEPPTDAAKEEIWRTGKAVLIGQGVTKDAAGNFLGKLVKDFGQVLVLQAVRDCAATTPADAKSWLVARCQERRRPDGERASEAVRRFVEAGNAP